MTMGEQIPYPIPAAWWRSLSAAEMDKIWETNGVLNHGQCVRLWELMGLPGTAPHSLTLLFREDEVAALAERMNADRRRAQRRKAK
jgi:hypothetical protein